MVSHNVHFILRIWLAFYTIRIITILFQSTLTFVIEHHIREQFEKAFEQLTKLIIDDLTNVTGLNPLTLVLAGGSAQCIL